MRIIILLLTLFLVSCGYHKHHEHTPVGTCILPKSVPPKISKDRTGMYEIVLIEGCEYYEYIHKGGGITKLDCDCVPASKRNSEWDNPE